MYDMKVKDIVAATGGTLVWGDGETPVTHIDTDSRKITPGALFVPIDGETFDGHSFIAAAFEGGAVASLTHKDTDTIVGKAVIKVDDTFKALADIARYYRKKFSIPSVAITGSVGKTTTKDMIAAVLSVKKEVLKTQGNFNNEIGLPLTVFNLEPKHEMMVLEMGMSGFGEIEKLSSIGMPDVAVITNIGMSHIEKLGSQEGILKAKLEILTHLSEDGIAVLNGDDKLLWGMKGKIKNAMYYACDNKEADITAYDVENFGQDGISFKTEIDAAEYTVKVNTPGIHNVYNALAAICVARHYNYDMCDIIKGIDAFVPSAMRMNIEKFGTITVINDCYNASPASMSAGLDVLKDIKAGKRAAILGDMLEMGDFAKEAHYNVGKKVFENGIDLLLTAGENAKYIAQGALDAGMDKANVKSYAKTRQLAEEVQNLIDCDFAVLVKASRGMNFEQITKKIGEKAV